MLTIQNLDMSRFQIPTVLCWCVPLCFKHVLSFLVPSSPCSNRGAIQNWGGPSSGPEWKLSHIASKKCWRKKQKFEQKQTNHKSNQKQRTKQPNEQWQQQTNQQWAWRIFLQKFMSEHCVRKEFYCVNNNADSQAQKSDCSKQRAKKQKSLMGRSS